MLLAGAVIQTLSPSYAMLGQAKVPVLLSLVIYYALNRRTDVMLCAALLAGFLQDALSMIPFGYSSAVFVLAGWLVGRYRKLVMTESMVTPLFFGAAGGVGATLLLSLLLARGGLITFMPHRVLLRTIGDGVLCMCITPVVFLVVGGLERMVGNVKNRESIDGIGRTGKY